MRLRRITTNGRWIPEVDGLRFVAILAVLLTHTYAQMLSRTPHVVAIQPRYWLLIRLLQNFERGVRLFFVISGFILAGPFVRAGMSGTPVKLGAYFKRRLTRLEPPYILSLLIYLTALIVVMHKSFRVYLPHLLASLFYVHRILAPNDGLAINFVTWSLEVEVVFYLCAPLIGLIFRVQQPWIRRGALLAMIVGGDILHNLLPNANFLFFGTISYFLIGFLLADLRVTERSAWRRGAWDLVSLAAWPLIFLTTENPTTIFWLPVLMLLAFMAALLGPLSSRIFRLEWVAIIGGMCYSIYLMHMLFYSLVFRASVRLVTHEDFLLNLAIQAICLIPAAIALSTVYFVLIERPCMDPKWPQKLSSWVRGKSREEDAALASE